MSFLRSIFRFLGSVWGWIAPEKLLWKALPKPLITFPLLGALTRAAFPPLELFWLGQFGLVLFFWYFGKMRRYTSLRVGFWTGFLYGFGYFYTSCFWLNQLIQFNAFIILGVIILAAIGAVFIGVFGVGMVWITHRLPCWFPLYAASSWTLLEWARGAGELGFPFFRLAHLYWTNPWPAATWGELGMSFIIALWAAGIAFLMLRWWAIPGFIGRRKGLIWLGQMGIGAAMLVAACMTPQAKIAPEDSKQLRLALVQPNIIQARKMEAFTTPTDKGRRKIADSIANDTLEAASGIAPGTVDLVIFPEATFPGYWFEMDATIQDVVFDFAAEVDAPVIIGADHWEDPADYAGSRVYNSVWLLNHQTRGAAGIYNKRHLVPFGEHVPYLDLIPGFSEFFVGVGSFDKGKDAGLLRLGDGTMLGPLLCFESAVSRLARESVRAGADLLVVNTNDGWFGESSGLHYHMVCGAFRAAETGRTLVQAANTGETIAFDAAGRVIDRIAPHQRATLHVTVPVATRGNSSAENLTFYTRIGDTWLLAPLAAVALLIGLAFRNPGKRRRKVKHLSNKPSD
jgi:apolipoprotein N-acyltransferase